VKKLGQSAIGTGATIYTVPTGYRTDVVDINIANTTAGALSVSIYLVPSGGSHTTSNMLFPAVSVPANTLVQWTGLQVLNTGDFIYGVGSGSGVTVTVSGDEMRGIR
jgi:hypothetical protein